MLNKKYKSLTCKENRKILLLVKNNNGLLFNND